MNELRTCTRNSPLGCKCVKDRVYGRFKIDSPVIFELINSKPLQRLKNICQFGVPNDFYHLKNYSRYEHSLGVYLLLRKLKASQEEQIAGLLHDISHTAFSHVIDWVLGDGKTEEYQNEKHEEFFHQSELIKILKKYQFNPEKIASHENFKLLEQGIPDLCADRLDYALKEFPLKTARYCFRKLTVKNGKIVFKNQKSAKAFALNFLKRQFVHWGGLEAVTRYRLFANAIRIALDEKIINLDDFWQNDDFILTKIKRAKNKQIEKLFSILCKKSLKKLAKSRKMAYKKFRYVDPEFLENDKIYRLSKVDQDFQKKLQKARKINVKGIFLPKIN